MKTGGNQSAGFTIVETLIVLTVSSVMAASSLLLINGKQNRTEFQVAVNNLKQQFEQIINETANGYYPTKNNFSCNGTGADVQILTGSKAQGTNDSCIFLGKALAFGIPESGQQAFTVYPLVAKRNASAGSGVSSFAEAKPIALAPDDPATYPAAADYSVKYQTRSGLNLKYARYVIQAGPNVYSTTAKKTFAVFAFANSLSQYSDTQSSSVQKLDLYEYDQASSWGAAMPATSLLTVGKMNTVGIDEAKDVVETQLCFASGGSKQSALISISGHGQLAVTTKIYGSTDCT